MSKLILVVEKGCKGCEIAEKNIRKAIDELHEDINLEVIDFLKITNSFIYKYAVQYFPTLLILSDDNRLLNRVCGSKPKTVYLKLLSECVNV